MKKFAIILFIILGLFIRSNNAFAQEVNSVLEKVRSKLAQVKDYQANALMKLNVSFLQVPDSKVIVYYKQPDKFRIRQEKGISLVPKGGMSVNLNSMLTNGKYTAVDAGASTLGNDQVKIIKLLPLDEQSDVVLSTLYIDSKNFLVKKVVSTTN